MMIRLPELMPSFRAGIRIALECTLMACLLGIALDLVTANVAVEYFSVHHPHVVDSSSPFVLALVWGIGASWWFGGIAGSILALVNARRKEPLPAAVIRGMMAWACVVLWLTMMAILITLYGLIGLIPAEHRRPSFDFDRRLMSVALTHMTEYVLGAVALAVVAVKVWRHRRPVLPNSGRPLAEGAADGLS